MMRTFVLPSHFELGTRDLAGANQDVLRVVDIVVQRGDREVPLLQPQPKVRLGCRGALRDEKRNRRAKLRVSRPRTPLDCLREFGSGAQRRPLKALRTGNTWATNHRITERHQVGEIELRTEHGPYCGGRRDADAANAPQVKPMLSDAVRPNTVTTTAGMIRRPRYVECIAAVGGQWHGETEERRCGAVTEVLLWP